MSNNNNFQFTHLSRERWAVTRNGDLKTGDKPFVNNEIGELNAMGDFRRKSDAVKWVDNGCPMDDGETLIWAKTWREANEKVEKSS